MGLQQRMYHQSGFITDDNRERGLSFCLPGCEGGFTLGSFMVLVLLSGVMDTSIAHMFIMAGCPSAPVGAVIPI